MYIHQKRKHPERSKEEKYLSRLYVWGHKRDQSSPRQTQPKKNGLQLVCLQIGC